MSEWKEVRLGDFALVKGGKRLPKGKILTTKKNSHPYIRIRDLGQEKVLEINDTYEYVDDETQQAISRYIVSTNDILISIVGTIGLVAIVGKSLDNANLTENCVKLVNIEDVDKEYLYYFLVSKSGQDAIKNEVVGAVQQKLPIKNIQNIKVPLPPLTEQHRIASILSSLDSKIENNRKICANLEAQAQALFKHWFIDFAPFKDGKFVESELGMIPEGLIYKRIEDMPHTLETGKRPAGGVKGIGNGIPSIGAENIKGLGCYDYSKTKFVPEEYAASMKRGKINGYELLIYKDGGKPGYFIPNFAIFGEGYPYKEMCLNEHVFKLDFGNKGYSLFAYFFFKTKQIMSYLNAQGAKAAIPGINSKDIEVIMMPTLENECVRNYCNEVEDILTQILVLSKESSRLSTLRDTLLPKLMSGEIKV